LSPAVDINDSTTTGATMTIKTVTHINLRGNARAALEFYQSVFGGHLVAVTFADAHNVTNPDEANQIMWGEVASPDGFHVMAYDVPSALPYNHGEIPYFISVRGTTADEITGYWAKLSANGTIKAPLAPAGFSPLYGMVTDQFGVTWVLDVAVEYNPA
jgi:PhnB protein